MPDDTQARVVQTYIQGGLYGIVLAWIRLAMDFLFFRYSRKKQNVGACAFVVGWACCGLMRILCLVKLLTKSDHEFLCGFSNGSSGRDMQHSPRSFF